MKQRLGDIAEFINGGAWSDKEYTIEGIPVVKVSNLKNGMVDLSETNFIPKSSVEKYSKHLLKKGDLVIATVGSHPNLINSAAGRATIIPLHVEGALLNQNAVCIRSKSENLDQGYIGYLGKSDLFQGYVKSIGRGAANQVRIALGLLKDFYFDLPPLPTQRRIASILSAYDDLIENNMRRIGLLEEKAFLRYRQVVREEKLVRMSVYDYAEVMSGGTPSTANPHYWNGEIPFFTPKDLSSHAGYYLFDTERKLTEQGLEKCNSRLFPRDTVFLTARGTVGKLVLAKVPSAISQSNYALTTRNGDSNYFLFLALIDKIDHFKQFAVGGVFDTIIVDTFKMIFIEVPNQQVIQQFHTEVQPLFQMIDTLQKQNFKLREARDILLPRLMSGEVNV